MQDETTAQAALLAAQPEIHQLLAGGVRTPGFLERFCRQWELDSASMGCASGAAAAGFLGDAVRALNNDGRTVLADADVMEGARIAGTVHVAARIPEDVARNQQVDPHLVQELGGLLAQAGSTSAAITPC